MPLEPTHPVLDTHAWTARWTAEAKKPNGNFSDTGSLGVAADLHPDGRVLTGHREGAIRLHDEGGKPLAYWMAHAGAVRAVRWCLGGRAVSAGWDGVLRVWDVATGNASFEGREHGGGIYDLALSRDGSRAITVGWDGAVVGWDLAASRSSFKHRAHEDAALAVSGSPDLSVVVSGGGDGKIACADEERVRWIAQADARNVYAVGVDTKAGAAYALGSEGLLTVWDLASGALRHECAAHRAPGAVLLVLPEGRVLSAGWDNEAVVWDASTGREHVRCRLHTGPIVRALALEDGRVATFEAGGAGRVWDPRGGRQDQILRLEPSYGRPLVTSAVAKPRLSAKSQSGRIVASGGGAVAAGQIGASASASMVVASGPEWTTRAWTVDPPRERAVDAHTCNARALVETDPGGHLVSSGDDARLLVWGTDGLPVRVLAGHTDYVLGLAAIPGKDQVASASSDGTIRLWDVVAGRCIRVVGSHEGGTSRVVWCSELGALVSTGDDGHMRLWDVDRGECLAAMPGLIKYSRELVVAGTMAFTWMSTNRMQAWDLVRHEKRYEVPFPKGLALDVDGTRAWVAEQDKIHGVDLETGAIVVSFARSPPAAPDVKLLDPGHALLYGGGYAPGAPIQEIELTGGSVVRTYSGYTGTVGAALRLGPRSFVTVGGDESLRLWDRETATCVATLALGAPITAAILLRGDRIAAGTRAGDVVVASFAEGEPT